MVSPESRDLNIVAKISTIWVSKSVQLKYYFDSSWLKTIGPHLLHIGSSAKSPKRGRSGKKGKTPEPEPEPEPEVPPGTPPPAPGSDAWEYVDQNIEEVFTSP